MLHRILTSKGITVEHYNIMTIIPSFFKNSNVSPINQKVWQFCKSFWEKETHRINSNNFKTRCLGPEMHLLPVFSFVAIKLSFSLVDICLTATLLTRQALLGVLKISELLSNLSRKMSMVLNSTNNEPKVSYMRILN